MHSGMWDEHPAPPLPTRRTEHRAGRRPRRRRFAPKDGQGGVALDLACGASVGRYGAFVQRLTMDEVGVLYEMDGSAETIAAAEWGERGWVDEEAIAMTSFVRDTLSV